MRIKYFSPFVVFITLFFTACQQNAGPGGKLWFYTHSTGKKDIADSTITPASFINLESNGTYTADLGAFEYGRWVYSNNQIVFTSQQNNKHVLPVNYLTGKEMQAGAPTGPFDNFESQPFSITKDTENPFSKENNQWRIKAVAKETPEQIKKRLLNHFRFWELYFTWALNDKIQYIDVRSTPTPVKIYGNGFGLKPPEELPATWRSYFFDIEDCRIANEKIKKLFDSNSIAWPHTDNKFKMFISAFQQMQEKLQ